MSNSKNNNGRPTRSSFIDKLREFISSGRPNDAANKKKEREFQKKYYLSHLRYQQLIDGDQGSEQESNLR